MSAAHNQAALRDKHGKVNGQLPVQIRDFIFNIQLKSPYSLNSKPNLFCPILTRSFSICATVGIIEGAEVRTDPQQALCLSQARNGRTYVLFLLHTNAKTAQALQLNLGLGTSLEPQFIYQCTLHRTFFLELSRSHAKS